MFSLKFRSILTASAASFILAGAMPALASHGDDDRGRDDRSGQRDDSNSSSRETRLRLAGRAAKDGLSAKAVYEARTRRGVTTPKFSVEIQRAEPGKKFEVSVEGFSLGTITANKFGIAKLELRRSPSGPNERPIPAGFPELKAGHTVKVGDLAVVLR